MAKLLAYGFFLAIMGLLLIFISLWAEEQDPTIKGLISNAVVPAEVAATGPSTGSGQTSPVVPPTSTTQKGTSDGKRAHYAILGLKLIDEIGIALFLLGAVVIMLEFPDWKKYFQKQIEHIIVEQAYLKKMSSEDLIRLQTNALIAFFKTDDIDRNESFLHFFQSRIHKYIGDPYREDVRELISLTYVPGRTDQVSVEETMSYRCRKVGDKIQDEVRWIEKGVAQMQQISLGSYDLEILVAPETFTEEFKKDHQKVKEARTVFKSTDEANPLSYTGLGKGFRRSLEDYKGVDGLHVKTHVCYTMPTNMPFTWTMANPTKGITGTITYPPDLELVTNMFGVTEEEVNRVDKIGVCQIDYDSWLLTDTGFSFQLMPKAVSSALRTATSITQSLGTSGSQKDQQATLATRASVDSPAAPKASTP
jgi:hypothetical protein